MANETLIVDVDLLGGDLAQIQHRATGVDLLFRTPWEAAAESARSTRPRAVTGSSKASWMDIYRGGWQLLLPNAGPPRSRHGAELEYHGEASRAVWDLEEHRPDVVVCRTSLISAPLNVRRTVALEGPRVRVVDRITNRSSLDVEFDYVQHPAFSTDLVARGCRLEIDAAEFVGDPDTPMSVINERSNLWPFAQAHDGQTLDLADVPAAPATRFVFGWLAGFKEGRARVISPAKSLAVTLLWDIAAMPYAWLWQELNETSEWPWFRSARVLAIEPSNVVTSGAHRRAGAVISPFGEKQFETALITEHLPPYRRS